MSHPAIHQGTRRGFTLIELLVVVAITAVLASLAFASLARALQQGQSVQSSGNLRQLTMANMAYAAEHGTFAPAADRSNRRRWHGTRIGTGKFDPTKGF